MRRHSWNCSWNYKLTIGWDVRNIHAEQKEVFKYWQLPQQVYHVAHWASVCTVRQTTINYMFDDNKSFFFQYNIVCAEEKTRAGQLNSKSDQLNSTELNSWIELNWIDSHFSESVNRIELSWDIFESYSNWIGQVFLISLNWVELS